MEKIRFLSFSLPFKSVVMTLVMIFIITSVLPHEWHSMTLIENPFSPFPSPSWNFYFLGCWFLHTRTDPITSADSGKMSPTSLERELSMSVSFTAEEWLLMNGEERRHFS